MFDCFRDFRNIMVSDEVLGRLSSRIRCLDVPPTCDDAVQPSRHDLPDDLVYDVVDNEMDVAGSPCQSSSLTAPTSP